MCVAPVSLLLAAAHANAPRCAARLLKAGADPDSPGTAAPGAAPSPLVEACRSASTAAAVVLLQHGARVTPEAVAAAAAADHAVVLDAMAHQVAPGSLPHSVPAGDGRTALLAAVDEEAFVAAQWLVSNGADALVVRRARRSTRAAASPFPALTPEPARPTGRPAGLDAAARGRARRQPRLLPPAGRRSNVRARRDPVCVCARARQSADTRRGSCRRRGQGYLQSMLSSVDSAGRTAAMVVRDHARTARVAGARPAASLLPRRAAPSDDGIDTGRRGAPTPTEKLWLLLLAWWLETRVGLQRWTVGVLVDLVYHVDAMVRRQRAPHLPNPPQPRSKRPRARLTRAPLLLLLLPLARRAGRVVHLAGAVAAGGARAPQRRVARECRARAPAAASRGHSRSRRVSVSGQRRPRASTRTCTRCSRCASRPGGACGCGCGWTTPATSSVRRAAAPPCRGAVTLTRALTSQTSQESRWAARGRRRAPRTSRAWRRRRGRRWALCVASRASPPPCANAVHPAARAALPNMSGGATAPGQALPPLQPLRGPFRPPLPMGPLAARCCVLRLCRFD